MTKASAPARAPSKSPRREDFSSRVGTISTLIIAAFCAIMLFVPWEKISSDGTFNDRNVYLQTFGSFRGRAALEYSGSVIGFLTNEMLWDMSVRWLSTSLHVPLEIIFGSISFLCLFVFGKYLVSRHGPLSLVFLLNPLIVVFVFSQLRLALAVSLLMLAMFNRAKESRAAALVAVACGIHTATFLLLFVFAAVKALSPMLSARRARGYVHWLALLGVGAAVVMVIGPMRGVILAMLHDRRVEYDNFAQGILYSSYWIVLYLATASEPGRFFEDEGNALAVAFLAIFVCAIPFNVYNGRFLAAAFPLIISALLSLGSQKRIALLTAYAFYCTDQWFYWLSADRFI